MRPLNVIMNITAEYKIKCVYFKITHFLQYCFVNYVHRASLICPP